MKVSTLIAKLQQCSQEAELLIGSSAGEYGPVENFEVYLCEALSEVVLADSFEFIEYHRRSIWKQI